MRKEEGREGKSGSLKTLLAKDLGCGEKKPEMAPLQAGLRELLDHSAPAEPASGSSPEPGLDAP